jgi:hypothetical protein
LSGWRLGYGEIQIDGGGLVEEKISFPQRSRLALVFNLRLLAI